MTTNDEVSEPGRKRARTGDAVIDGMKNKNEGKEASSASDIFRANKISKRLYELLKEFPEIKFIFDFENLQENLETALINYAEEKEAKKRKAQLLWNYGQQEIAPFCSLPDEVLSNCLSFVGKGHYGVVGLVSKKLNEAYKDEFGRETAYLEMATSIELSNYCLNKLCKNLGEKDEVLKAAAVNGNLDVLRAAVKDGHDLFPLVAMKKRTIYPEDSDYDEDDRYDEDYTVVYYANDYEKQYSWDHPIVKPSKLVERGHLHVLKYLYEELHYFLGLQRYIKPAIEYGQLETLEWLDDVDILFDDSLRIGYVKDYDVKTDLDFCECAIKSGNVESLDWLMKISNGIDDKSKVLADAIKSKSTEMIQYCFDLGYDNLNTSLIQDAIKQTKSVEVYRKMHELGCEFNDIKTWLEDDTRINEYFEIIKFLRSISVPWCNGIMNDIVVYGTLEMIQFAHEEGCPWTTHGEEYYRLLESSKWSFDKLNYLKDNGCTLDYEYSYLLDYLIYGLRSKKELALLDYFVGKNSNFDNKLYKEIVEYEGSWIEGISYMLENGKDIENFKSIEVVFHKCKLMDGIKFFHGLGLPWCLDSSRNNHLLSKIACYYDLDDVKWAYENGCRGGNVVPYVQEEWGKYRIRDSSTWKANQVFFEENGLLDEVILQMSGIKKLDPKNVQEIGDEKLESIHDWFHIDYTLLKSLVDHGYMFASELEQNSICKEAYEKCCEYSHKEDYRKRLVLFNGMGVRDL